MPFLAVGAIALIAIGVGMVAASKKKGEIDGRPGLDPGSGLQAALSFFQAAAMAHRIPISWIAAFGRQESSFNPRAANIAGTDGARGGSFGWFQITIQTATAWGLPLPYPTVAQVEGSEYTGPMIGMMHPDNQATAMAVAIRDGLDRGYDLANIASIWNSGKDLNRLTAAIAVADADGNTILARSLRGTRDSYVPRVVGFAEQFSYLDGSV